MTEDVTSQPTPLEQAVDHAVEAFVYAPIGLIFDGPALFPKLVQQGKQQVQVARMMGEMGVQMGRKELNRRAAAHPNPVFDILADLGITERPPAPAPAPAPAAAAPAPASSQSASQPAKAKKPTAPPTAEAPGAADAPAAESLAIPDYESLSASHVVKRLRGLAAQELAAIEAYEQANRARKTVLNRIAQLTKD